MLPASALLLLHELEDDPAEDNRHQRPGDDLPNAVRDRLRRVALDLSGLLSGKRRIVASHEGHERRKANRRGELKGGHVEGGDDEPRPKLHEREAVEDGSASDGEDEEEDRADAAEQVGQHLVVSAIAGGAGGEAFKFTSVVEIEVHGALLSYCVQGRWLNKASCVAVIPKSLRLTFNGKLNLDLVLLGRVCIESVAVDSSDYPAVN